MLTEVKSAEQSVQGLKYLANRIRTGSYDMRMKSDVAPTKKGLLKVGSGKSGSSESKSMFSFLKKGK